MRFSFAPLVSYFFLIFPICCFADGHLTYAGAIKEGNSSGTIPAWTGGLKIPPANWNKSMGYVDPFSGESPIFTITQENISKHSKYLTNGQAALLQKVKSFRMPVYTSHRTIVLPKEIISNVVNEVGKARISSNSIVGRNVSHIPFPNPKTGEQAIYNFLMRYLGNGYEREYSWFPVRPGKKYYRVGFRDKGVMAQGMKPSQVDKGLNYAFYANFTAPSTLVGTVYLVHDFVDTMKNRRAAWIYSAGARRVRRAPDLEYDNIADGTEGMRTTDQYNAFNGATDRYNWKLLGRKELYVPYNTYKITDKKYKYSDVIDEGTVNAGLMRYELHRVWVVEATLKPDKKHIYGKRVFYLDEDSWSILGEDSYDTRGELWRVGIHGVIQAYDKLVPWPNILMWHDLTNGNYLVTHLDNEVKTPIKFDINERWSSFQPDALRRRGTR
jgi:hypothetical protein